MIIQRYRPVWTDRVISLLKKHHIAADQYTELETDFDWIVEVLKTENLMVLATEGEELLGLLWFTTYDHWHSKDLGASDMVVSVAPAHRNGRVAKALIRAAEEWARQIGCVYFQLSAAHHTAKDLRTIRYYSHLGYKDRGSVVYKLLEKKDGSSQEGP